MQEINEAADSFVKIIETGDVLLRDERAKPRVPFELIISALKTRINKPANINIKQRNVVEINGKPYHYYAQYNSGNTNVPWYGITEKVVEELRTGVIEGVIFLYFKTANGNINGEIQNRYFLCLDSEKIKNYGKEDENRYLFNFSFSNSLGSFMIENNDEPLIMKIVK